jgi:hypothetical protein
VITAEDIPFDTEPTTFRASEGRYAFTVMDGTIDFIADRLRRERHDLHGELEVRCVMKGVRTYDGTLNIGSLNFSSPATRRDRARLLAERAKTQEVDWLGYLEEFTQRVLSADRAGEPAISLPSVGVPPDDAADDFEVLGLRVPRHHPAFVFGDGGTCKSLLAPYLASELDRRGERVGFFEAELDRFAHRRRLGQLFSSPLPDVRYVRIDRPLVHDVDRCRRIVRNEGITYGVFDSVAFMTNGAPESAEAAGEYFRAVRQIGIGSLHIAHVTKGEHNDQKPFGSVFWHNGARSTWFAKMAGATPDPSCLTIGLFHRKANLGPLRPAVGLDIRFSRADARRAARCGGSRLASPPTGRRQRDECRPARAPRPDGRPRTPAASAEGGRGRMAVRQRRSRERLGGRRGRAARGLHAETRSDTRFSRVLALERHRQCDVNRFTDCQDAIEPAVFDNCISARRALQRRSRCLARGS